MRFVHQPFDGERWRARPEPRGFGEPASSRQCADVRLGRRDCEIRETDSVSVTSETEATGRRRAVLATRPAARRAQLLRDRTSELAGRLEARRRRAVRRPYVPGEVSLVRLLGRPAALGTFASLLILLGASLPSSPFTLKIPGAWFFGISPPPFVQGVAPHPGQQLFLGVVAVYGGMLLMLRAWWDLAKITQRHPGLPVRAFVPVFIAWVLPMLVVAPLFSLDVYSYAAQGEMMSRGISPYQYGPSVLGANAWVAPVSPIWLNVTSPYGPLFLAISSTVVSLSGHRELWTVVGLRAVEVVGVAMMAVAVAPLARSYGFDGASAFVLAICNPLVIWHLVAGAHNDALMMGFLVLGLLAARRGRPLLGLVLCGLGAAVKVPAMVGVVYVGWEWLGDGVDWRGRVRPVITAMLVGCGTIFAVAEMAGLGWGWIRALGNPETVVSYLDPATALGKLAGGLASLIGFGGESALLLSAVRDLGLLAAALIGIRLLFRSTTKTSAKAMGYTFLAVVVLGPVLEPWYAAWGIVLLALVATSGTERTVVLVGSAVASFIGLPGGATFLAEIRGGNPLLLGGAAVALAATAVGIVWIGRRRRGPRASRELGPPRGAADAVAPASAGASRP
jgi:alpha-1,6-mannosyltransferase